MKRLSLILALFVILFVSCSDNKDKNSVDVVITNPIGVERIDQYVELDLNKIEGAITNFDKNAFAVMIDGQAVPAQIIGKDKIGFVVNLAPNEKKTVTVKSGEAAGPTEFKSRAYAEIAQKVDYEMKDGKYIGGRYQNFDSLRVPDDHIDHNELYKYEGPGWESDKVGYRMYIDWRNRTDIFGNTTNDLVLKKVGVKDLFAVTDSYHELQSWGMDVFKVNLTLGIGTYAMYSDTSKVGLVSVESRDSVFVKIPENGPVLAGVHVDYYGWQVDDKKYDLSSDLSITAGSRLTKADLKITNNPECLITGFAKYEGTEFIKGTSSEGWNYIGLYGTQSLNNDDLGIALFYNNNGLIKQTEDDANYIVELKPQDEKVQYYFCAAWEKEPNGIKNIDEFKEYLELVNSELNNPVKIEY